MRRRVEKRGSSRMKELGYKPLSLWIHEEEFARLEKAAEKNHIAPNAFALAAIKETVAITLMMAK